MDYRDFPLFNDPLSAAIRAQMEQWDRITGRSAIGDFLAAELPLTRQIDMLMPLSTLSDRVAEVTGQQIALQTGPLGTLSDQVTEACELVRQINLQTEPLGTLLHQVTDTADSARRQMDLLDDKGPLDYLVPASLLLPPTHELTALNHMIHGSLADINWGYLDRTIGLGFELGQMTRELTTAYQQLAIQSPFSGSLFTLNTFPAIELYTHANLLSSLSHSGATAPEENEEVDDSEIREEIEEESGVHLQGLLAVHYPDLLDLWLGAQEALSNEHDPVRKYCVSMRVLLEQLLLKAAPNNAVGRWTADPKYFDKGRPTKRARFAYICDRASRPEFSFFVATDVKAVLVVWGRLNKGVHEVSAGFTLRQLKDLQIRSNCLILIVLLLSIEAAD